MPKNALERTGLRGKVSLSNLRAFREVLDEINHQRCEHIHLKNTAIERDASRRQNFTLPRPLFSLCTATRQPTINIVNLVIFGISPTHTAMSSINPDQSLSGKYTPELDHEFYYALAPHEKEFLHQQTGISDEAELKTHLVALQERAYKVSADSSIHS